jgi:hypothetical protein
VNGAELGRGMMPSRRNQTPLPCRVTENDTLFRVQRLGRRPDNSEIMQSTYVQPIALHSSFLKRYLPQGLTLRGRGDTTCPCGLGSPRQYGKDAGSAIRVIVERRQPVTMLHARLAVSITRCSGVCRIVG